MIVNILACELNIIFFINVHIIYYATLIKFTNSFLKENHAWNYSNYFVCLYWLHR